MTLLEAIHNGYVVNRRGQRLCDHLVDLIPRDVSVLDVGCGDGLLACLICQRRNDIELNGIDISIRDKTYIPVSKFDGEVIPYDDSSYDVVMLVDVLHHTRDPRILLREARRVSRKAIAIKDHTRNGLLAQSTLKFMDKIGNARHGTGLTYNYWPRDQWIETFEILGLRIEVWRADLHLYPWPASHFFDRSLHFIALLDKAN